MYNSNKLINKKGYGNIIINSSGSGSTFEGFYLNGFLQCGVEANCNNILIKRYSNYLAYSKIST